MRQTADDQRMGFSPEKLEDSDLNGGAETGNAVELWRGNVRIGALMPRYRYVWQRKGVKMKNTFKALALAGAMAMSAVAAQAATLSIDGGTNFVLTSAFSLTAETGLSAGDTIKSFNHSNIAGNGLELLGGASPLEITFIGKEAGATNLTFTAINTGSPVSGTSNSVLQFNNQSSAVGSSVIINNLAGLVNFFFQTTGLDGAPNHETNGDGIQTNPVVPGTAIIRNGTGADDTRISIGLFQNQDGSVFAFFGDGRGDNDYDDMALSIRVVPLPAGGLLLLTALGGIAVMRRRKAA